MDAPRLRPLGIGEILDAAINIYRSRFATLLKVVVVVVAPVQVLSVLVTLSVDPSDGDTVSAVGAAAAFFILFVVSVAATQLATATSLRVVSNAYMGQQEEWQASLGFATRRFRRLILLTLLLMILGGIGLVLCIIPGVYLFIAWAVVIPVLLVEGRGAWASMERSRELVKGNWWRVFGCYAVAFILAAVVSAVLQAIFTIPMSSSGFTGRAIVNGISGLLAQTLTTPFTAAVLTVMYFDLRVRKEGFDLELLARSLGQDPPAAPPAPSI